MARVPFSKNKVVLQAEANDLSLQFRYGESTESPRNLGEAQTMAVLSFEMSEGFNGPFVGIYASSNGKPSHNNARVNWFEYKGN